MDGGDADEVVMILWQGQPTRLDGDGVGVELMVVFQALRMEKPTWSVSFTLDLRVKTAPKDHKDSKEAKRDAEFSPANRSASQAWSRGPTTPL